MSGEHQDNVWPLPKFTFSVSITDVADNIAFQEVSGLDTPEQPIEYRAGDPEAYSVLKMPGLAMPRTITLKKGVFTKSDKFWGWYSQIKMNTIKRQSITISLLDQEGNPTMTWKLANALPTKVTGTDLKSEGNEVAVESLEIVYDTLTVENG